MKALEEKIVIELYKLIPYALKSSSKYYKYRFRMQAPIYVFPARKVSEFASLTAISMFSSKLHHRE